MIEEVHLRVHLGAPIIPGEGAAGLRLGHKLADYVDRNGDQFRAEKPKPESCHARNSRVLRSDHVTVYTNGEIITQVSIHSGYRGSVRDRLRLEDAVGRVATELGCVGEDDEDNLVCASMAGMCFEIPASLFVSAGLIPYSRAWLDRIRDGRICEIFVFTARCDCGSDLRNRPDHVHCPGCGRTVFEALDL